MPGISIDELTLDLPGFPESQARRLAMGIADGLAAAGIGAAAGDVPIMRIDLTASAGADTDGLARRIVADIVRQVRRLP
ncbi:MAG TPA: hypothetical protein VFC46_13075 [Humisphaera sp.]|nr:hypothetical protein [Humisphaera sp.]